MNSESVICFAINQYGDGEHPMADAESLPFFAVDYTRDCLRRLVADLRVREEVRTRALSLIVSVFDGEVSDEDS